jgi:hypothetical protein
MPDFGVARARLATRGYGSPWFVDLVLGRPEGHDSAIITAGVCFHVITLPLAAIRASQSS